MSAPLILVTSDQRSFDNYVWAATPTQYLEAVAQVANGVPVIVPTLDQPLDVDALLDRADGVVATGSRSNVHPSRYGGSPTEEAEPYDQARDAVSLKLIARAIERGVPLLAICRGMQELNAALGGTLHPAVHTMPGRMDHRPPEADDNAERFKLSHVVDLVPDGALAEMLGETSFMVNSLHRQAMFALSDRLVVEATAPDGTIEAVRVKDAPGFAFGVQWHPEFWARTDPPSRRLFEAFGDAARAFAAHKTQSPAPAPG